MFVGLVVSLRSIKFEHDCVRVHQAFTGLNKVAPHRAHEPRQTATVHETVPAAARPPSVIQSRRQVTFGKVDPAAASPDCACGTASSGRNRTCRAKRLLVLGQIPQLLVKYAQVHERLGEERRHVGFDDDGPADQRDGLAVLTLRVMEHAQRTVSIDRQQLNRPRRPGPIDPSGAARSLWRAVPPSHASRHIYFSASSCWIFGMNSSPCGLASSARHTTNSAPAPAGRPADIANEDGTVVVVQNGEIYNYRELRTSSSARGTGSGRARDTEVLVHAYEEWGLGFAERLRGMFAVAIWDARRRRLVLARDRFGIKPLYYRDAAASSRSRRSSTRCRRARSTSTRSRRSSPSTRCRRRARSSSTSASCRLDTC